MDANRIQLATCIVHVVCFKFCAVQSSTQVSIFGFVTNTIAIATINKSLKINRSFRILCTCVAINNIIVLVLFSVWYLLPDNGIFEARSFASRAVGMIGQALFIVGIRFHILISVNRLASISHPFESSKYINSRRTSYAIAFVIIITFLQCSPFLIVDEIWLCYNRETMQWSFASDTEIGLKGQAYLVHIPNFVEFSIVIFLDVATLVNLRKAYSQTVGVNGINSKSRATEVRLFKQAFSQTIPLLFAFVVFAFVAPKLSDDFDKFLSTTLLWHLAHGIDGYQFLQNQDDPENIRFIIDIFHTRLELFVRKTDVIAVAVSSSFALTSVV